MTTEISLKTCA